MMLTTSEFFQHYKYNISKCNRFVYAPIYTHKITVSHSNTVLPSEKSSDQLVLLWHGIIVTDTWTNILILGLIQKKISSFLGKPNGKRSLVKTELYRLTLSGMHDLDSCACFMHD